MRSFVLAAYIVIGATTAFPQSVLLWSRDHEAALPDYFSTLPVLHVADDTMEVIGVNATSSGQRSAIVKYDLEGDLTSNMTYGSDSVGPFNTIVDHEQRGGFLYILQKDRLEYYKSRIVLQKYALDGVLIWARTIQSTADTSFTPLHLALINDTSILLTAQREYGYPEYGDDVIGTVTLEFAASYGTDGAYRWVRQFDPLNEVNYLPRSIVPYDGRGLLFGTNSNAEPCLIMLGPSNEMEVRSNIELVNGMGQVSVTPDGGLIVSSWTRYRVTELDMNGDSVWTTYYGTNLPSNVSGDEIRSMTLDEAGNIIVTGRHYGDDYGGPDYSNADILTVKYDGSGHLLWQNRFEYGGDNADIGNSVEVKNGFVYVAGQSQRSGLATDYDYVVLKIDASTGGTAGVYRYNGPANGDDVVYSCAVLEDGRVALTGLSGLAPSFGWTTQLLSDIVLSVEGPQAQDHLVIHPNPASGGDILFLRGGAADRYSIISATGQVVQQGRSPGGMDHIRLDMLDAGLYLVRLYAKGVFTTHKLMVR